MPPSHSQKSFLWAMALQVFVMTRKQVESNTFKKASMHSIFFLNKQAKACELPVDVCSYMYIWPLVTNR